MNIEKSEPPNEVRELIEGSGGTIKDCHRVEDHGFLTASFPLPKTHWIYENGTGYDPPPMPFRMAADDPRRDAYTDAIIAAGKYAVRGATMRGTDMDFDPDALLQNLVVGFLGYHTEDGLSGESWGDPTPVPPILK